MWQGYDPTKQKEVDDKMKDLDGTDNKAKLGANAILAVSLAVAKVCRSCQRGFSFLGKELLHTGVGNNQIHGAHKTWGTAGFQGSMTR